MLLVTESENLMVHPTPILPINSDNPIGEDNIAESKVSPLGRELFEVYVHIQNAIGNIRRMNEEIQI